MLNQLLIPAETQLCIHDCHLDQDTIVLIVGSTSSESSCPHCLEPSSRLHGQYERQPTDVPLASCAVRLCITVRRFFCDNPDCQATTFGERMSALVEPYAHRTRRLAQQQQQIAFESGGEAGARMTKNMGIPASPDTLLRLLQEAPEPELDTLRVLGVDDFALRKGHTYGTILVDLEKHQPVDLLPDRSAESLVAWLKEHPGVEIISRDRGKEYVQGATEGTPDATQVADRWHLLKNLRDKLEEVLVESPDSLKTAAEAHQEASQTGAEAGVSTKTQLAEAKESSPSPEMVPTQEELTDDTGRSQTEALKVARQAARQERYEAVQQLHQEGLSKSAIARRLQLNWRTVAKYLQSNGCPQPRHRPRRRRKLDDYQDILNRRWEEGCHNATQLWRELREQGFNGSRRTVSEWPKRRRGALPEYVAPCSPRRASWLFVKPEEELEVSEQHVLARMQQCDADVASAYKLGKRFAQMVRQRQPSLLDDWLADAINSGIKVLKGFAKSLQTDIDAVGNALRLPWSQGQVEGQVNRLKLIKRKMYGRCNFDLLRRRVLMQTVYG